MNASGEFTFEFPSVTWLPAVPPLRFSKRETITRRYQKHGAFYIHDILRTIYSRYINCFALCFLHHFSAILALFIRWTTNTARFSERNGDLVGRNVLCATTTLQMSILMHDRTYLRLLLVTLDKGRTRGQRESSEGLERRACHLRQHTVRVRHVHCSNLTVAVVYQQEADVNGVK